MAPAGYGSPLRATIRLLLYGGFTLSLMPVQALAVLLGLPLQVRLPHWYHRHCCRILGLRIVSRGRASTVPATLFVANHVSYFDIAVLGGLLPVSFVAKREVSDWPLFGWLAKLQRSVFVERRGKRAAEHRNEMVARLEKGDSLVLFAEGTSGDGNRVLPFKSALFSVAEARPGGKPLIVQPVSIAYTKLDGLPLGRALRPFFAWYGDMDLASHMWQAAGMGLATVEVEFYPEVTIAAFGSRKALCDHCHAAVAAGVAAALTGQATAAPKPPMGAAATA